MKNIQKLFFVVFFRLFEGSSQRKIEKLKTLLCYFRRVTQTSEYGNFSYHVPTIYHFIFKQSWHGAFSPHPTHPRAQRSCYVHKAIDKQSSKMGKVCTVLRTAVLAKCYFTGSVTLLPQLLKSLTSESISVHIRAKSDSPGWLSDNVSRTVPLLLLTAGFNISQLKTIIFFMLFSNLAPRNSWPACTSPVREPLRKMDMGCCR